MAPKLAAVDTWRSHATVRIGLAVPGRPIGPRSRRTGVRDRTGPGDPPRQARSTFGPHAIGFERFATVSTGTSSAQVRAVIQGKQASVKNPDKG